MARLLCGWLRPLHWNWFRRLVAYRRSTKKDALQSQMVSLLVVIQAKAQLRGTQVNQEINSFLATVLGIMQVTGGTLAAVSIAWGGFLMIFSEGNAMRASRAKFAIMSALVGLGILLLATAIASLVTSAIPGATPPA